jgi:uncharacterized membrane protein
MKPPMVRALCKAATYKTVTTAFGVCLAILVTGDVRTALTVGLVDFVIRTAIYVAHERAWARVAFGREEA